MKKLGFIGVGNMGGAIIGGILRSGKAQPGDIIGADKSQQSAERAAKQYSIEMTTDNRQVAQNVSILFLSVKPQFLDGVIEEIRDVIREEWPAAAFPISRRCWERKPGLSGSCPILLRS